MFNMCPPEKAVTVFCIKKGTAGAFSQHLDLFMV